VGKRADLILLDANPLADISRAATPSGVMVRGRWLPGVTVKRMLNKVAANYAGEEKFVSANFGRDTTKVLKYLKENDPFDNLLNEAVASLITDQGIGAFKKLFEQAKLQKPEPTVAKELFINALGYRLLGQNKSAEALEVLKFNVEAYPKSGNTYDSLAETYLANGNKELAIKNYKLALEVEPNYGNAPAARDVLKKLEAETKP
jgi:tetratricopeptide (TPR) repeat protein